MTSRARRASTKQVKMDDEEDELLSSPSSPSLSGSDVEGDSGSSSLKSKISTPATSVMGENKHKHIDSSRTSKRTPASRNASERAPARGRSSLHEADGGDSTMSELSDDEASAGETPAAKKAKVVNTITAPPASSSAVKKSTNSSSKGPMSSSHKRRSSPEVIVYTKRRLSAAPPSSSPAATTNVEGKKRARSPSPPPALRRPAVSRATSSNSIVLDVSDDSADYKATKAEDDSESEGQPLSGRTPAKKTPTSVASRAIAKGKGRAASTTASSAPSSRASSIVASSAKRTLAKLKQESSGRKQQAKKDAKGKGKKTVWTDDEDEQKGAGDDSEGSDFKLDSEDGESENSAQFTESGSEDEDQTRADSDDLTDIDELVSKIDQGSPADAMEKFKKVRQKRIAKGQKKDAAAKKLSWWEKNELALEKHHPELVTVWSDLKLLPVIKPQEAEQPSGLTLGLLPFQKEGLYWMLQQERGPWKGGMLADEMGMGKTIQTISLILSDHDEKVKRHTLILAPTVAIMQWRNEFNKFTSGLHVCVWHGGNRSTDKKELLKYDIILTSYAVLESSFRRQNTGFKRKGELLKEESVLHAIDWHRVILDEAHNIKDRSCNTARGAFALKANFRWCLSGTPLQNRVGELYSLIRFLGSEPFSYYFCKKCPCRSLHWKFSNKRTCDQCGHTPMHHICYWNNEILKPIQKYGASNGGHGTDAFEKLGLLLARMMLRRTKVERADDMGLPPRVVTLRRDFFTEEEEEFYSSLYSDVKRTFSTYVAADSLLNNYANVFQLLTRMRQTACHPDLVLKGRTAKALLGEAASTSGLSISTCRLCLDEGEEPVMSKCKHVFCRECIRQYLETAVEMEPECPVCHVPLTIDINQEISEELLQARQGMLEKIDPGKWRTSTKIEALVEELSKLKTEDHSIKSLVFSQFTSFLDLIARRLQLAGFKIARLQGNMTPEARDRTVKYFMNTTDCTVFLLSLKAGGVALNLTEASRVYIMDPWWNPSAEYQAIDRVHRIGQHRPIIATRFVIENSIESKIVELGKKKQDMVGSVLKDDDSAMGRLTEEDLSFLFTM